MNLTRRQLCKYGALGSSMMLAPKLAGRQEDPHFFILFLYPGGMDTVFNFDSRDLVMTERNLLINLASNQPELWTSGMDSALIAEYVVRSSLKQYRNDFTIINGIHMSTGFDGHEQNLNFMFAGNAFGGSSFMPIVSNAAKPVDFIQSETLHGLSLKNTGGALLVDQKDYRFIQELTNGGSAMTSDSLEGQHIQERLMQQEGKSGQFSNTVRALKQAWLETSSLQKALANLDFISDPNDSKENNNLRATLAAFKANLTTSALFPIRFQVPGYYFNLDTHDFSSTHLMPRVAPMYAEQVAGFIKILKETPYDDSRSFYDVTTFMVGSEFSRTMRKPGFNVAKSGNDHNTLNNTLLVGGKGVVKGQIIGQSNFRSPDETLSNAHLQLDLQKIKMMGHPLDFSTGRHVAALPEVYDKAHYLTFPSIINTLYKLFGVPTSQYVRLDRNFPDKAKTLDILLS